MNICVFAGTFNPIHNAHIKMAEFALEKYGFDKIIFIPSYLPPHKDIDKSLSTHRYNMVKLAISDNKKFEISDIEYKSEGKSYSLITVKKIIEQYKISGRLNFIIGTDAFSKIESWYHADELKRLVHFIVFPRQGDYIEKLHELKDNGWDFELVNSVLMNISSTEIRQKTKNMTDKKIEEYIKDHGLYKS